MNSKQILAISMVALFANVARADGGDIGFSNYPTTTSSDVSRSEVKADVLAARADGELRPTGEAGDVPFVAKAGPSNLSRQDVKLATLRAAKAGQLMPAGEETFERPPGEAATHPAYSSARSLLTAVEKKFRSN